MDFGNRQRFLQSLQGAYLSGGTTAVVPRGLGVLGQLPLGTSIGVFGGASENVEADPKLLQKIRDEVTKVLEEEKGAKTALHCPKSGETEKFRTEVKEFSPRGSHHDIICEKCNVVVRQLHRIKGDERDWSCTKKCKFHLSDESPLNLSICDSLADRRR